MQNQKNHSTNHHSNHSSHHNNHSSHTHSSASQQAAPVSATTYNLIILDRSGSMESIRSQAVAGVNETVGTIKALVRKHPDSPQKVSLVAFCSCANQYLYTLDDAAKVKPLQVRDYQPCCCTPLYDAIGEACTTLHNIVKGDKGASVSVTIITDGYENASKEWNLQSVQALIKSYKSEGWLFAYIGADHDVEKVSKSLQIDNSLCFDKTEEGTRAMFVRESRSRARWFERRRNLRMENPCCCEAELSEANADYFAPLDDSEE